MEKRKGKREKEVFRREKKGGKKEEKEGKWERTAKERNGRGEEKHPSWGEEGCLRMVLRGMDAPVWMSQNLNDFGQMVFQLRPTKNSYMLLVAAGDKVGTGLKYLFIGERKVASWF